MGTRNIRKSRSICAARAAGLSLLALAWPSEVRGATLHTWVGTQASWTNGSSWNTNVSPSVVNISTGDVAELIALVGRSESSLPAQPTVNANVAINQLLIGSAWSAGWTISGTGSLNGGINGVLSPTATGVCGLYTSAGAGDTAVDLGNGAATSVVMSGPADTAGGAMIIGSNSRLILTGNTVASINNALVNSAAFAPPTVVRGGALVLDNSAGNPTSQRLTTGTSAIQLIGGGATLELRGASSGTSFTGVSGALTIGGGDAYIRMIQNGSATLGAAMSSIGRTASGQILFVENIGSGFVGAAGKPTLTSSATESNLTVNQTLSGVISASPNRAVAWALVTNRATTASSAVVTGRWANYSSGIVASTPTTFTGSFGSAAAAANVLFAPTQAGTIIQTATPATLASVVFEPAVAGVTLSLGTNKINTFGVALSGANDMSVTSGSLLQDDSTAGSRAVVVLNPTTTLSTSSSLGNGAAQNNGTVNIGGQGIVALTGSTNQFSFTSPQSVNLGGGVLRAKTSNFVTTNAIINFRGGTLEYDVTGANVTFSKSIGNSINTVNWGSMNASSAGEQNTTNVGSGGFSAYTAGAANVLTVNLGGAGAQVNWNDPGFVASSYALKFGSIKSNATVAFQNPIGLGTTAGQAYRTRVFDVTQGAGTSADETKLTGVISGAAGYDLIKTGTGVLETTAANTYEGNTIVTGGELRIGGTHNPANPGALIVTGSAGANITGGSATYRQISAVNLTIQNSGKVKIKTTSPGPVNGVNDIANLTITTSGQLDLTNNALLVRSASTGDASRDARWAQVVSGQNSFDNNGQATWDGPGIVSSVVRSNNVSLGVDAFAIGVISNHDLANLSADGGAALPYDASNPWLGTISSVGAHDILIRMTYAGDTNLDGQITIDDYNNIDGTFSGVLPTNYGWVSGDFDFNGAITIDDYNAIDTGFLYQGGQLSQSMIAQRIAMFGEQYVAHLEQAAAIFASVPEPGAISLAGFGAIHLLARRRKRR